MGRSLASGRSQRTSALLIGVSLLLFVIGPVAPAAHAATDVGYQDGSYSGSAPTGREPQSKLWFNDGIWWASMYSSGAHAVDIYKLNWSTQTWSDTGVLIDERSSSSADTLWDGSHLYMVSAVSDQSLSCSPSTSGDITMRLLRYSYNASTKTYSRDAGFPVTIANARVQAVSLAKDTTGTIWVTWGYPSSSHGNVYVAHSTTDTAHYSTPSVLPLSGVTTMQCADYSAIVAYNGHIGIMWSNQTESDLYFGSHVDGDPDTTWTRSNALQGAGWADNHVNIKSLTADPSGQVFAASKTSLNGDQCPPSVGNSAKPLIVLTWMDGTGGWQHRTVSTARDCWTRPLVVLDSTDRQVYVFGTQPAPGSSYGSGGSIVMKQASLDNPNFDDGTGTPVISLASNPKINNVTSTKQAVDGASGLVVLAADDSTHHYVHNGLTIGGPDLTPPTVASNTPADGAANVSTSSVVTASFSESIAAATVNASTFTLSDATTATSVPATVTYNSSTRTATLTPQSLLPYSHGFSAKVSGGPGGVTDLAGNPMAADFSWGFTSGGPPTPVFTDGFESNSFSAWSLTRTGGDGTARVQTLKVVTGTYAAQFTATTNKGSLAYARETLAADQGELYLSEDVQMASQGSSKIPLLRMFDSGGSQRFSLDRSSSGALSFTDGAGTVNLTGTLAVSTWAHVDVHLVTGSGGGVVEVSQDGAQIYSNRSRTVTSLRTLQIGNDVKRQSLNEYVDNVAISVPGTGPVAPDTTLTSGPSGRVNTTTATFTFSSSQPGATFSCSLDGGAGTACTSPQGYSSLLDGDHTFAVAATANGLTDPSPATASWTVDTAAPGITLVTPAANSIDVPVSTSVQATFSEPMAASSINGGTVTLTDVTGGGSVAVPATVAYNASTHVATLTPSAPLAASHAFGAKVVGPGGVTDVAGNAMAADFTWTFTTQAQSGDTTLPSVTLVDPAEGASVSGSSVSLSATAADNVAVDHVAFFLNSTQLGIDSTDPYSMTWDSTAAPNGPATITARAVDTSGNYKEDTHNITVANSGGATLFSDDFESGTFGAWSSPVTAVDGTATVQNTIVKSGAYAAQLTESSTSGSKAYVRKTLGGAQSEMTVTEDVRIFAEGTSSQNVPLLRMFDTGGTRLVSLFRQSQSSNKLYIGYGGSNRLTTGLLPLNTWATVSVHVIAGSGNATIEVRLNGTLIYQDTAATLAQVRTLQIGNDTSGQPLGIYVDNFVGTSP